MSERKKLYSLIVRNTKCYFKDKFTFFISMISPVVLLVLFVTFLRNVYIESFTAFIPDGLIMDNGIVEGLAGAWLMSSVLGVSSVTVAFCSNFIMVTDKMDGTLNDFLVSPVKGTTLYAAYFLSNFLVTLIIMVCVMLVGHLYLAAVGWYVTAADFFLIFVDIICGVLFGTLLSGVVCSFISKQGGLSAVATLVSGMYSFICGAYMPLSQFSDGLRNVLCLLPGTYGVGILRNHYMDGYLKALSEAGVPAEGLKGLRDGFDANLYLFGTEIPLGAMYAIILGACAVLAAVCVTIVFIRNRSK